MRLQAIEAALLDKPIAEISLKGPRTYIQSADLWNALERRLMKAVNGDVPLEVGLTFRRLTSAIPVIVDFSSRLVANRFADLRIGAGEGALVLALTETDQQVMARTTCPEADILPDIQLASDVATVAVRGCASPIERLIAAVKYLHLNQVNSEVKWLAGRLTLEMPFASQATGSIEARLSKQLPHGATLSRIKIDGKSVGTVIFSPAHKET